MSALVPLGDAKARFAEVVRRAERGETIVLTRHGRPVARLSGLEADPTPSRPGLASGMPGAGPDGDEVHERAPAYPTKPATPAATENRRAALERLLEDEVWPRVPEELLGKGLGKREREEILGLDRGPEDGGS